MIDKSYLKIANYYNNAFNEYGDTPEGLAWDNQSNLDTRYKVMYELIKNSNQEIPNTLLDFGCGYGGFYQWLKEHNARVKYTGVDINNNVLTSAKEKFPETEWLNDDIHSSNSSFSSESHWDYIICNGTFTVKDTLTQEEMTNFMYNTLEKLWAKVNKGIAFNVMSKLVDWERDDLFHVSLDELGWFLKNNLSRNFVIRNDYKLYEYTVYVYK